MTLPVIFKSLVQFCLSQSQNKTAVMESGMLMSYMIEYERMTHMLASQEFFIAQYQENLYRLYLESAAQFSQLPQTQECSGQISALQDSISHQDTMRGLVRPLDLSKDSKTKSLEIKEEHTRPVAITHKGKTYSRQECKCPFCGKMFSRPWLLKGKFKSSSFEDINIKSVF